MSWSKRLLLAVSLVVAASPAAADPLDYRLQAASLVRMLMESNVVVTFTPPVGEPVVKTVFVSSDLTSRPTGIATADVGIPGFFQGGERGLWLDAFDAHSDFNGVHTLLNNLFDEIVPLLPVPPPVPLVGAVLFVDYADLDISLVTPLQSGLASVDPLDENQYYWGGVATLEVSGSINLKISVPGREDPIPFEPVAVGPAQVPGALAGEFTGDSTSTRLVVGLEEAEVGPDVIPPPEPVVYDLAPLGSISVTTERWRVVATGNFTGVNTEYPMPPPVGFRGNPGTGCGIGPELTALMPLLGWLWRRRRA